MATGEVRGSFSMSEPELRLRRRRDHAPGPRRDGDEFVIDGQKMWLTNGGTLEPDRRAGARPTRARSKAHQNLTTFLVEKPAGFGEVAPGLTIPGKIDKMGYKGVDTTEMVFDGFRIAADAGPRRPARRAASAR